MVDRPGDVNSTSTRGGTHQQPAIDLPIPLWTGTENETQLEHLGIERLEF